ncbi:hypothetical protein ACO1PK_14820 [Alishewanella sp. d11]|uniref:hypothetical protein n=1 Tax=Alishewanella sp. d11 TaxID=3414030 RepID=UPI003BF82A47
MTIIKHFSDTSPLPLNQDYSSCLTDNLVEHVHIQQRELKHLDLYQVSALQTLALHCPEPAERHVRVQGASALKSMQLSGHSENRWVIHLDLPNFPHGLSIEAPLAHLDMCWLQENELLTLTPQIKAALFHEVVFFDLSQMTVSDFSALQDLPEHSLVVCYGGYQQAIIPTFANIDHLLFTDIAGIDCLTVSQVKHLVVQRAIGLRSIAVLEPGLVRLQLQQCPQFSQLTAPADFSADEVQFTDAAHGSVALAGRWNSVKLRRSALTELAADQIDQLHVTDCPNLQHLRVGSPLIFTNGIFAPELLDQSSFSINEGMIRDTLQKLTERMDQELVEALLQQALRQYKPYNVGHAIMLLQALAELGYDIARLWELRAILQLKNQRRQVNFRQDPTSIKVSHWRWNIKIDRIFESYEADFLLWLKAKRQGLPEADSFTPLMVQTALVNEPTAFFTICTMLSSEEIRLTLKEKLDFLGIMTQKKLAQTNTWLNLNDTLLPSLNRLCHYFKQLCATAEGDNAEQQQLLKVLFQFLLQSVSPKLLSGILPAAMQVFPEYVRPQLLAMANDSKLPYITRFADVSYDSVKVWYTKAALAKSA